MFAIEKRFEDRYRSANVNFRDHQHLESNCKSVVDPRKRQVKELRAAKLSSIDRARSPNVSYYYQRGAGEEEEKEAVSTRIAEILLGIMYKISSSIVRGSVTL